MAWFCSNHFLAIVWKVKIQSAITLKEWKSHWDSDTIRESLKLFKHSNKIRSTTFPTRNNNEIPRKLINRSFGNDLCKEIKTALFQSWGNFSNSSPTVTTDIFKNSKILPTPCLKTSAQIPWDSRNSYSAYSQGNSMCSNAISNINGRCLSFSIIIMSVDNVQFRSSREKYSDQLMDRNSVSQMRTPIFCYHGTYWRKFGVLYPPNKSSDPCYHFYQLLMYHIYSIQSMS